MVESTTSLRGHYQQKETIHDYITLMGIEQRGNIKGKYVNIKPSYVNYKVFRKALQEYDYPDEAIKNRGSKNMKCFIDAANTKYEVVSSEYYSEYFTSTVIGAALGAVTLPILSHVFVGLAYCSDAHNKLSQGIYYATITVGGIIGGAFGYELTDYLIEYNLEQQAFVDAAHKCYDNIHEPVGEITATEMDAYV